MASNTSASSSTLLSKPPTREERQRCWTARDAYWDCLDKNGLWLHGLRPREKPKEGGEALEAPVLNQAADQNVRANPFGPNAGDASVANVPDGSPTGKKPSGENKVTINRNLTAQEIKELSICEKFKDAFEKECAASWVGVETTV